MKITLSSFVTTCTLLTRRRVSQLNLNFTNSQRNSIWKDYLTLLRCNCDKIVSKFRNLISKLSQDLIRYCYSKKERRIKRSSFENIFPSPINIHSYCFYVTLRKLKELGNRGAKVKRDDGHRCRKISVAVRIYRCAELAGIMLLFLRIVNIGPAPQVAYLCYREIRDTMPADRVTPPAPPRLWFMQSLLMLAWRSWHTA